MSTRFKKIVEKMKIGLKSYIIVQNMDSCCPRGHRLFQNTFVKLQTSGLIVSKSKFKEFRSKKKKPINSKFSSPFRFDEAVKPYCQKKKKKY